MDKKIVKDCVDDGVARKDIVMVGLNEAGEETYKMTVKGIVRHRTSGLTDILALADKEKRDLMEEERKQVILIAADIVSDLMNGKIVDTYEGRRTQSCGND